MAAQYPAFICSLYEHYGFAVGQDAVMLLFGLSTLSLAAAEEVIRTDHITQDTFTPDLSHLNLNSETFLI